VIHRSRLTRRALAELAAQHAELRGQMARCAQLADELDAGGADPTHLTREVAKLRLALDGHNRFEEQLLRPVLLADPALSARRVEALAEEHAREHQRMRDELGASATADLRAVIASLRAHLAAEERALAVTAPRDRA
jgi:iron-sulfur cluster repair protein YtfE (RIC family)